MKRACFTYGSLMCEDIMARVAGGAFSSTAAMLHGYARHPVRDETYPAIVPRHGASVAGRLYREVDAAALQRLDAFEGEMYARTPVCVELPDGGRADAEAYVFRPAWEHLLMPGEWDFERFLAHGKAHFLARYLGFSKL
ncbi:gamma-glutamylcyclotransferase [Thauera sp. CAU 1555]|uniref:Putative gamma-glutamylcyclotransferase n=1 Tax=Thauera sedimentorum TaxID=2767595 RepID=A0ABR9BEK3_9RHOO|nr:gamma-glutamylcyclotransferase family protein [Thauera sedimentorum]MBC9073874.1 gamma-glutamylcyclotransferase [Thauera sedimentorum]MBD8504793.1 gamma-glutamylcyclotransferase [Thauera sedimentorum]